MPDKSRFTLKDIKEIKKLFGGSESKKSKPKKKVIKSIKEGKIKKLIQQQKQIIGASGNRAISGANMIRTPAVGGGYTIYPQPNPLPFRNETMQSNDALQTNINNVARSRTQAERGDKFAPDVKQITNFADSETMNQLHKTLGAYSHVAHAISRHINSQSDYIDRSNVFPSRNNGSENFRGGDLNPPERVMNGGPNMMNTPQQQIFELPNSEWKDVDKPASIVTMRETKHDRPAIETLGPNSIFLNDDEVDPFDITNVDTLQEFSEWNDQPVSGEQDSLQNENLNSAFEDEKHIIPEPEYDNPISTELTPRIPKDTFEEIINPQHFKEEPQQKIEAEDVDEEKEAIEEAEDKGRVFKGKPQIFYASAKSSKSFNKDVDNTGENQRYRIYMYNKKIQSVNSKYYGQEPILFTSYNPSGEEINYMYKTYMPDTLKVQKPTEEAKEMMIKSDATQLKRTETVKVKKENDLMGEEEKYAGKDTPERKEKDLKDKSIRKLQKFMKSYKTKKELQMIPEMEKEEEDIPVRKVSFKRASTPTLIPERKKSEGGMKGIQSRRAEMEAINREQAKQEDERDRQQAIQKKERERRHQVTKKESEPPQEIALIDEDPPKFVYSESAAVHNVTTLPNKALFKHDPSKDDTRNEMIYRIKEYNEKHPKKMILFSNRTPSVAEVKYSYDNFVPSKYKPKTPTMPTESKASFTSPKKISLKK